eukprot:COSAG01_NODE_687_length_14245_cov_40.399548_14_plen_100_part_00
MTEISLHIYIIYPTYINTGLTEISYIYKYCVDRDILHNIYPTFCKTDTDSQSYVTVQVHYYGSDPYDTFRITTALMRWNRLDVSERILTRQLGRRCRSG